MADITYDDAIAALKAADASGNTEDAKQLAIIANRIKFQSTPGGAAVGNPNMQAQGERAINRTPSNVLEDIGGAGVTGGLLGYAAPEILQGIGGAVRQIPYPVAQTVGGGIATAGQLLQGYRGQSALTGALSGIASETAGQIADATAFGKEHPALGEAARFFGGGLTGDTLALGKLAVQKYLVTPSLGLISKMKKEIAKSALEKLDSAPQKLTEQERQFIDEQITALRGGVKTDQPLENVGALMGQQGQNLMDDADKRMISALQQQSQVGPIGGFGGKTNADIGTRLRDVITTRNQAALDARAQQFAQNEKARDVVVNQMEQRGRFVTQTPAYESLIKDIQEELKPGVRSPSIQAGLQKILNELQNPEKDVFGQNKPISFQALDDVRRKLGDAFRGKPAEGYDALTTKQAKDLYQKVSDVQKQYAGPIQSKLLEDYHLQTQGMEPFTSKIGKKATALDQFRSEQYATDASSLPSTYFKTRASVQALKELTGSNATVATAALEHADKELAGKNAEQVRDWMTKNGEWLSEVRPVQMLVNKYATKLEDAERSLRNAEDFAKQAAKDNTLLTRNALPAQRAVDLIKSGNVELWDKVTPAIVQSPQAKSQMVQAVRQVVADQGTSQGTLDLFNRNIRPFLEKAKIASPQEMDFIAQRLENIKNMNMPEKQKLGLARTFLLNATGSWAASAASRAVFDPSIPSVNMIPNYPETLRPQSQQQ